MGKMNRSLLSGGMAVLTTLLVPCGLPLRAAESPDAAIEHGKERIAAADYTTAERDFRRAMSQLDAAPDHRYFTAAANLGVALYYRRQFPEAEAAYVRALSIRERMPASSQSEIASVLNNLAVLYSRTGRLTKAEQTARDAVRIREEGDGPDSISVAGPLITLAAIFAGEGKYAEAEAEARRAVGVLSAAGPEGEAKLPAALRQLAAVRVKAGDLEEADRLLSRARETGARIYGPDDPEMAAVYSDTGALRLAQRRYREAVAPLQQAVGAWQRSGQAKSRDAAVALNNLAQAYKLSGDSAKAEPAYRRAIAACAEALGREDAMCALFASNYADLLRSEGRGQAAVRLYEKALTVLEKRMPPDHADAVRVRSELSGIVSARQQAWTVAVQDLRRPVTR